MRLAYAPGFVAEFVRIQYARSSEKLNSHEFSYMPSRMRTRLVRHYRLKLLPPALPRQSRAALVVFVFDFADDFFDDVF